MTETVPAPTATAPPPARHTLPFLVRYFAREARETPPTFAMVEFSHPLQFNDALKALDKELAPAGVPVREIRLNTSPTARRDAPAQQLIAMLNDQPEGALVMVRGFEEVLPTDARPRRGVLELFNWYRETIAERPLHQVWWVTPELAVEMALCIPDLDSWFLHRLDLREDERHARADIEASGWRTDSGKQAELLARADELYKQADKLDDEGRYVEAAMRARGALRIRETVLGLENQRTLDALTLLAITTQKQGDLAGAEPLYRRALAACERTLGPEHSDTLNGLNNLGYLLRAKGDLTGAEPLYRRALDASERTLGPEHSDTLISVNNLAILLDDKGDRSNAMPLYLRALATRERTLGPEHPHTLSSVNNLAGLLNAEGDLAGAEPLLRRALTVQERTLGPEHPDTLISVNNLAALLKAKGDLAGAEPLLRRALEARERTLGPEHPSTLRSLSHLAAMLNSSGDRAGAEPLHRRAAEAAERLLGPGHPDAQLYRRNLDRFLADAASTTDADAPTTAAGAE